MSQPQPQARPGSVSVTEHLIAHLRAREQQGIQTYGMSLTTHNGRNALRDALEETLDCAQYLDQAILEREALRTHLQELYETIKADNLPVALILVRALQEDLA